MPYVQAYPQPGVMSSPWPFPCPCLWIQVYRGTTKFPIPVPDPRAQVSSVGDHGRLWNKGPHEKGMDGLTAEGRRWDRGERGRETDMVN